MHESHGSTLDQPASGPISGGERHLSMDLIRGVALFGILLMNIVGFGYGLSPGADLAGTEPWSGGNFWAFYIPDTFFEGTQRGLFSILFGAGVIVLTSRIEARNSGLSAADVYYRRNLWLIGFGMVDSYLLLWDGDILYFYGLAALFLYPLRNMKPKHLVMIGVAMMLILTSQSLYERSQRLEQHADYQAAVEAQESGSELDEEQEGAIEGWQKREKEYFAKGEKRQEDIDAHRDGYGVTFMHHLPDIPNAHGTLAYRFVVPDAIAFMTIGMALFKWGVMTLTAPARIYWLLLLVGYGIGVPLRMMNGAYLIESDFHFMAFVERNYFYDMERISMTLGHLGLLLLFVRSEILGWLQRSLAAVGRMALTNYIMHSVICLVVFLRPGFGLYGSLERHELYYVVFGIWILQLIVSPIWLKHFRFGPLEWLWRSLTYLKKQPMRRTEAAA